MVKKVAQTVLLKTVMVQVNADGQGNDFYNAAQLNAHADIDLDALDVYDMYAKGHIEV